jgi:hypothetical protein
MALTTFLEMKQELKDNWQDFASNQYPEDLLTEFADSACPVYYSDIIQEWQEMPSEFDDSWRDFGEMPEGSTITKLMLGDLFNYYHHLAHNAYNELADEMEPAE